MQINDALQQQAKDDTSTFREDVYYMTGSISQDSDEQNFRFYHNPSNSRSYFVIPKNKVIGELYPLTDIERAHGGFVKADVFRFGIQHGTKVRVVNERIETIGETISAETSAFPQVAGTCRTSTCSSECCTEQSDGTCSCDTCCIA